MPRNYTPGRARTPYGTTEKRIVDLLKVDEFLSNRELADIIGCDISTVCRQTRRMLAMGTIREAGKAIHPSNHTEFHYYALVTGSPIVRVKRQSSPDGVPTIKRRAGTWADIPKTDISKGFGYVAG